MSPITAQTGTVPMTRTCCISAALLLVACLAAAQEAPPAATNAAALRDNLATIPAGDKFTRAQAVLTAADDARDNDEPLVALRLYQEALKAYVQLATEYPSWQPSVTKFRIVYCDNQLNALLRKLKAHPEGNRTPGEEIPPPIDDSKPKPKPVKPQRPVVPSIDPETAHRTALDGLLSASRLYLKVGEPAKARELLMKALRIDPDNVSTRILIGAAHCQEREFEHALQLLEPLVTEFPSNAQVRLAVATAHFGTGSVSNAVREIHHALELDPDLGEAHFDLAQLLAAATPPDLAGAREHYQKALELGGKRDPRLEERLGVAGAPPNGE